MQLLCSFHQDNDALREFAKSICKVNIRATAGSNHLGRKHLKRQRYVTKPDYDELYITKIKGSLETKWMIGVLFPVASACMWEKAMHSNYVN